MSASNVRNIDSLEVFHGQLVRLSSDWDKSLQEIRALVHRAEDHFSRDRPAYWRRQMQLAERELTEAKDNLSSKQSAARAQDRPAATEAVKRVRLAERRAKDCESKIQQAKSLSIEVGQACDAVLGPLAEVTEHCEVVLPAAARQLRILIDQLRLYAEQSKHHPNS
jgi:hypothetical protein